MRAAECIKPTMFPDFCFPRQASKWLLFWVLLLLPSIALHAQLTYTNDNGAVTITGYSGDIVDLNIPETIEGLPVRAIGDWAFAARPALVTVTIPGSVTNIGYRAFDSCTGLSDVTTGNGVIRIEQSAFQHCYGLTNLTLGNSLTEIGPSAFQYCRLLDVVIPDGVITIGKAAFFESGLTSLTIPTSVTTVGFAAFANCLALTNVAIGKSVTTLGDSPFIYCLRLVAISADIGNPAYSAADGVLFNKTQTVLIQYPSSKPGDYTVPESVTTIGPEAFHGCENLRRTYFRGNPPITTAQAFATCSTTAYYLPGKTGWGSTYAGRPAVLWNPSVSAHDNRFGVHDGKFGFTITGSSGIQVMVEASNNLADPVWVPLAIHTLTGGSAVFSDAAWSSYPNRFYRFRAP